MVGRQAQGPCRAAGQLPCCSLSGLCSLQLTAGPDLGKRIHLLWRFGEPRSCSPTAEPQKAPASPPASSQCSRLLTGLCDAVSVHCGRHTRMISFGPCGDLLDHEGGEASEHGCTQKSPWPGCAQSQLSSGDGHLAPICRAWGSVFQWSGEFLFWAGKKPVSS